MIAVFARPDHPNGYGFGKTAHGYSVILVRCSYADQLAKVQQKLASDGLPEPMGHGTYQWYGGKMDLLATIVGNNSEAELEAGFGQRRRSIGDNRFVGLYDAAEILYPPAAK